MGVRRAEPLARVGERDLLGETRAGEVGLAVQAERGGEMIRGGPDRRVNASRGEWGEEAEGEQEGTNWEDAGGESENEGSCESGGGKGVERIRRTARCRKESGRREVRGVLSALGVMGAAMGAGVEGFGRSPVPRDGMDRHWGLVTAAYLNKNLKGED